MSKLKKYIVFIALVVVSFTVTAQTYASTLYSNNFTSDYTNWTNFYGTCTPTPSGLTCFTNLYTANAAYQVSFPSLTCISGTYTITNNGLNNLQLLQNNNDLGHVILLKFVIGDVVRVETSDFGNFLTNYVTPNGTHNYKLCQTTNKLIAYVDDTQLLNININHNIYQYFGFQLSQGNTLTSFQATDTLPAQLTVPLFKQTDMTWGTQTYDSADQWAPQNSTISRWGCALTSAAMILQYYHIDKLPDGTALNPGTLNTWLKNHRDGYVNGGWVNWLAIASLTHQAKLSGKDPNFAYDALEYINSPKDDSLLTQDLNNQQPDILEEPGHFIVGTGQTTNSYTVNDPYYSRTDLTQGYNNSYLSLGRYIPSHTDLSYIMMTSDPSLTLTLTDSNNISTGSSYIQNPIVAPDDPTITSGNPLRFFYAPKPATDTYFLNISGQPNQTYSVTLYLYDKEGHTLDPITLTGTLDATGTHASEIHFDNQSISNDQVNPSITFDTLLNDILRFQNTNDIQNGPAHALLAIAQSASKSAQKKNIIPANVQLLAFEGTLDIFHNRGVSESAYNILRFDAQQLLQSQ